MAGIRDAREIKCYSPEEVREKLDEYGVSPNAFSQMVGIASPIIYGHLSKKRGVSRVVRIRIAEVLDELGERSMAPRVPEGAVGPRIRRL